MLNGMIGFGLKVLMWFLLMMVDILYWAMVPWWELKWHQHIIHRLDWLKRIQWVTAIFVWNGNGRLMTPFRFRLNQFRLIQDQVLYLLLYILKSPQWRYGHTMVVSLSREAWKRIRLSTNNLWFPQIPLAVLYKSKWNLQSWALNQLRYTMPPAKKYFLLGKLWLFR